MSLKHRPTKLTVAAEEDVKHVTKLQGVEGWKQKCLLQVGVSKLILNSE